MTSFTGGIIPSHQPLYVTRTNNQPKLSNDEVRFLACYKTAHDDFKKFDRMPEDKETFTNSLESSFNALHEIYKTNPKFFEKSENLHEISNLFHLLGRKEYPGQMEKARQFFQTSLLLKFAALGFCKTDILKILMAHPSTTSLVDSLSKESPESRSLLTDLPEKVLVRVDKQHLLDIANKSHLLEISIYLRWLGFACQNIADLQKDGNRFEKIYRLSKECNQNIMDYSTDQQTIQNANWEMVDLQYNTDRFLLDFKGPKEDDIPKNLTEDARAQAFLQLKHQHVLVKLESLKLLEPYLANELKLNKDSLRARIKQGQLENIQAIEKWHLAGNDIALLDDCFEHSSKALKIAESTPNYDPNLLNMFRSNNSVFAMEAKKENLARFVPQMEQALQHAKTNENYYNPLAFISAARLHIALLTGKATPEEKELAKKNALFLLDKADEMAKRSPENAEHALSKAKELRNTILGVHVPH